MNADEKHPPPYLTEEEIADICKPLVTPAARTRFLRRLGMVVHPRPNRQPLVARSEFERVMVGGQPKPAAPAAPSPTADVIALRQHWAKRSNRNGAATRGG